MSQCISIDIGTTVLKGALFDQNGEVLFTNEYRLEIESEQTPAEWVSNFELFISSIQPYLQKNMDSFIVFSGHGPSTVYLNSKNQVIYYISWQSNKKIVFGGEKSYYLPQIAYVIEKEKTVFEATSLILSPAEYLSYLLTEQNYAFIPNIAFLPYIWDEPHFARYQLSYTQLSPPLRSGETIGNTKGSLARKLGLRDCTVVSGGLDYLSAMLGSGTLESNKMFLRFGSSVMVNLNVEHAYLATINRNISKMSIKPTFTLPGLINKHINLAYTIQYFDQIYQATLLHLNPQKEPHLLESKYADYVYALKHLSKEILTCVQEMSDKITKHGFLFQNIKTYFINYIKEDQLGISYLALLLYQTNAIYNVVNTVIGDSLEIESEIAASGGHANDVVLMQLIADNTSVSIATFDPVHTELLGNYYLGNNSLETNKDFRTSLPNVHPARVFHPRK